MKRKKDEKKALQQSSANREEDGQGLGGGQRRDSGGSSLQSQPGEEEQQRTQSFDSNKTNISDSGGKQDSARKSKDEKERKTSVGSEELPQERQDSLKSEEGGQVPKKKPSEELLEKIISEREAAGFKSKQTIMRRRRRRNPYANEYVRHYAKTKMELSHKRKRRIKEIGIPCASSETDSSDMSRVSNLSEFTSYEHGVGFKILHAMLPVIIFANIFGQFPLYWRKNRKLGTVTFYFRWWYPITIIFVICGLLAFIGWSLSVYNYYTFQIRMPNGTRLYTDNKTVEERRTQILIDRNLFAFFVVMLNYMAVWIITIVFLTNTTTIANYFSYWTRSMVLIKMDPTWHALKFSIIGAGFYSAVFVALIVIHYFHKSTATGVGAPTVTGILLVRSWEPNILEQNGEGSFPMILEHLQLIGSFIMIYVYMAPKVYLLLFLFQQKLLQNCFQKWNGRAYAGALMNDTKINKVRGRCTHRLLFRDHCVLVDLLQETSRTFAGIFEALFITDCIGICLWLYLFAKDWKYGKRQHMAVVGNYFIRPYDWVAVFVYLTGSVIMDVVTTVVTAEVSEAAGEGLDIIRRKPMVGRRHDENLLFVLSMYASFTSHTPLEFSGANFFYINKDFIQDIASTIFSYFIIFLQFMPPLDTDHDTNMTLRADIGHFLSDFERLRLGHWKPINFELEFDDLKLNDMNETENVTDRALKISENTTEGLSGFNRQF